MNTTLMLNNFAYGFLRFVCVDVTLEINLFLFITESCIN